MSDFKAVEFQQRIREQNGRAFAADPQAFVDSLSQKFGGPKIQIPKELKEKIRCLEQEWASSYPENTASGSSRVAERPE